MDGPLRWVVAHPVRWPPSSRSSRSPAATPEHGEPTAPPAALGIVAQV